MLSTYEENLIFNNTTITSCAILAHTQATQKHTFLKTAQPKTTFCLTRACSPWCLFLLTYFLSSLGLSVTSSHREYLSRPLVASLFEYLFAYPPFCLFPSNYYFFPQTLLARLFKGNPRWFSPFYFPPPALWFPPPSLFFLRLLCVFSSSSHL